MNPRREWWAPWSSRDVAPRDRLLDGIREYHDQTAPLIRPALAELALQQTPRHLLITCVDSRVVPNLVTASGPGDLFVARNIANLVPAYGSAVPDDSVMSTVEYAINVIGIKTITICGHTSCGGMAAVLAGRDDLEHLPTLHRWLGYGDPSLRRFLAEQPDEGVVPLTRLVQINVMQQLDHLRGYPWLGEKVTAGEVELIGMYLDLESAEIQLLDEQTGQFHPVAEAEVRS